MEHDRKKTLDTDYDIRTSHTSVRRVYSFLKERGRNIVTGFKMQSTPSVAGYMRNNQTSTVNDDLAVTSLPYSV